MNITNHAVDRYCERIRRVPVERVRDEMAHCFAAAKKKHLDRLARSKHKRTVMVETGCCIFVFGKGGIMVTVLPRDVFRVDSAKPAT